MIIIDKALQKRQKENNPIRVAMIGAGEMAKGMINQITRHTPGMKVVAIYNRNEDKALVACQVAGIDRYSVTNDFDIAQKALDSQQTVITSSIDMLCRLSGIDVVVENTGTIEFGAEAILKAIENGIAVYNFNAELDATLGPVIYKMAQDQGVKYTLGDGDQPGVTMNLYRYVKNLGFTPMVCGNIKGMQDRYRTPATQKAFAAQWGMNPVMATNFADGTKISFEQACIANATGMKVAQRGMLGYESRDHVDNLTHLFDVDKLKELGGIVDYVVGAVPSPGVFVYATADDPLSVKYLKYGKLGDGPLYSFYNPYHLLFFDIASSICRLIDFDDPVIVPEKGTVVDVITVAKEDIAPGEILDGIGGFKSYGICENHALALKENLLPMGMAQDCVLKRAIKKDQPITWDDVEVPSHRLIDDLWKHQRELFK